MIDVCMAYYLIPDTFGGRGKKGVSVVLKEIDCQQIDYRSDAHTECQGICRDHERCLPSHFPVENRNR